MARLSLFSYFRWVRSAYEQGGMKRSTYIPTFVSYEAGMSAEGLIAGDLRRRERRELARPHAMLGGL
jgi:hypothetical protein